MKTKYHAQKQGDNKFGTENQFHTVLRLEIHQYNKSNERKKSCWQNSESFMTHIYMKKPRIHEYLRERWIRLRVITFSERIHKYER